VSIARENPGARRRRNFWLGECKEFKLKSKKKFAADEKIFPARGKKCGKGRIFYPKRWSSTQAANSLSTAYSQRLEIA
jgi:hypothetical protein